MCELQLLDATVSSVPKCVISSEICTIVTLYRVCEEEEGGGGGLRRVPSWERGRAVEAAWWRQCTDGPHPAHTLDTGHCKKQ